MRSASPKPSSQDEEGEEEGEEEVNNIPLDPGLANPTYDISDYLDDGEEGGGINTEWLAQYDWWQNIQQNLADAGYTSTEGDDEPTEEPPIYGCTEVNAYNYNPEATVDDGSCLSISSSGYGPMLAEGETKSKLDSWLQQFKDEDSDDEDIIAKLPIIGTPPPALVRRLDNQQYPQTVTLARFRQ